MFEKGPCGIPQLRGHDRDEASDVLTEKEQEIGLNQMIIVSKVEHYEKYFAVGGLKVAERSVETNSVSFVHGADHVTTNGK